MLSHGVSFWHPHQIRDAQVRNQARKCANRPDDEPIDLSRDRVIHGKLNVWRDWLQITLNALPLDGFVDALRSTRSKKHAGFANVWKLWTADTDHKFNDW
jgi:hypothetical protein